MSSNELFTVAGFGALGRLELALGNLQAAGSYLRELPAQLLAAGYNDPVNPVWADSIETLAALGELELAGSISSSSIRTQKRWGAGGPSQAPRVAVACWLRPGRPRRRVRRLRTRPHRA